MEKLINSAFDFFAYALPGFCVLASFFILDETLNTSREYLELADEQQAGSGIFLLGIGYAVGFAITPLGRRLYQWFSKQKWLFGNLDKWLNGNLRPYAPNETGKFISDKFVPLRELSPNNFRYIESWHVYSLMAHNMAVAGLVALSMALYKIFFCHPPNPDFWWKAVAAISALIILFLYSAAKFNIWAQNDLNAAIVALKLEKRAELLAEQKEGA